jgi:hypothetical protein
MRARLAISALAAFGAARRTAGAATTFEITASAQSAYVINDTNNPSLTLNRGETYAFHVIPGGHPLYITTARGADDAQLNQFPTGVTGAGIAPGTVTFVVPASAPATLFYQCGFHDPMGGTLNIVSPATPVPALGGPAELAALAAALLLAAIVLLRRHHNFAGQVRIVPDN